MNWRVYKHKIKLRRRKKNTKSKLPKKSHEIISHDLISQNYSLSDPELQISQISFIVQYIFPFHPVIL